MNNTLYSSTQKVTRVAFNLNSFFKNYDNIKQTLFYQKLGTWGSVKEFVFVGFEIQVEITKSIVTLNSSNKSILIKSIQKYIRFNNLQSSATFKEIIGNMSQVLQSKSESPTDKSFSPQLYVSQQAQMYTVIQSFITSHSDQKSTLFNVEIANYGTFEFYFQTTLWVSYSFLIIT